MESRFTASTTPTAKPRKIRTARRFAASRKVLLAGRRAIPRRAAAKPEALERFGQGTPDDWIERNLYTHVHDHRSSALMMVIDLALFGVAGSTIWAVQMMWIPFFAAGVINGVGHYWGYRNFECQDASAQHRAMGHADRRRRAAQQPPHVSELGEASRSKRGSSISVGSGSTCSGCWVWRGRSAQVRSSRKSPGKSLIDKDTLWAVLNDRFRVMANYAERVVAPAVELEVQRADAATRAVLKRAKTAADARRDARR